VSLFTKPRPDEELVGLVRSLTKMPSHAHLPWWKRPEALAVAILVAAVAINIFFA
jgi:solute:Na+ symporter, SSS family